MFCASATISVRFSQVFSKTVIQLFSYSVIQLFKLRLFYHSGSILEVNIIEAFEADHEMLATRKFRKDSCLTMAAAPMHYRGSGYDANFGLVYADGEVTEILDMPNYHYNRQKTNDLKQPLLLPAGTGFRPGQDNSNQAPRLCKNPLARSH